MKKIIRRFSSSSHIQIVVRGITLLFATLAIVSAQNAASPGDKAMLPLPQGQVGMAPESPNVTDPICGSYVVGQIGGNIVPGTTDIGNH